MVGCCVFLRRFAAIKATTYVYFCLFFPLSSPPQTTAKCPPHTFHHGLTPSLISPPSRTPIFGWLMCPPIKRRPLWSWPHPPLSYFLSNISTAERTSSRHLPTSRRGHTPSPIPPPPSMTPKFGWLLCPRHAKMAIIKGPALARLSLFFDGSPLSNLSSPPAQEKQN